MSNSKDIVKSYVRYLKLQRNMSVNTLDAYQRDLRKLLDYLEHEDKSVSDVTLEDLEHFAAGLHDIDSCSWTAIATTTPRNCWSRHR